MATFVWMSKYRPFFSWFPFYKQICFFIYYFFVWNFKIRPQVGIGNRPIYDFVVPNVLAFGVLTLCVEASFLHFLWLFLSKILFKKGNKLANFFSVPFPFTLLSFGFFLVDSFQFTFISTFVQIWACKYILKWELLWAFYLRSWLGGPWF